MRKITSTKQTYYQYDLEGNFIKRYESANLAAIENGIDIRVLNKCLTGKTKSSGGYKWKYEESTY